ncbi:response regulator [Bradyrhizobium sp. 197]|uniref:response regulator n=1 Tax=Bradyrhizobium sp. 197 TaxID=2782663 RepID=UPI001FF77FC6|nr:response regulator [Bradyrhizobium sp. 197]MCK1480741.1 response regulator [Bradyrhizobium sp. 197]
MRCLLVEDEPARVAAILPDLMRLFGRDAVEVAQDRDTAIVRVNAKAFDLIVLDQRIPSAPGQLDPDVAHGRAVLEQVRQVAPDTIVYFLTALPMGDEYVDHLVAQAQHCDVFGDRRAVPVVRRFQKSMLAPFFAAVEDIAATARTTDQIEINTKGAGIQLSDEEARLVRCFGRLQEGVCVDVEILSDGLSGARVLKTDVKNSKGEVRISAVAKLSRHDAIANEVKRYEQEVIRLPAGSYAPLLPPPVARVLASRSAFYRLLEGYDRSIFQILQASDENAAACVKSLQDCEATWAKKPNVQKGSIGDFAKLLVWEDRLPAIHSCLDGIDWQAYEQREISVNVCTRHGDLHGENARANATLQVMLLDYGSVDPLPSAIDAVTLELSAFFHPHGCRSLLRWQAGDKPVDWFDREAFSSLTTVPNFIRATRAWAHADGFGDREVLACAYIYVLRQMQFPNTDRDLAAAILAGIVARGLKG